MKKYTTSERLKEIMNEYGLRQVDIVNRSQPYCEKYGVRLNKSDVSQYVAGKFEPSQEKLVVLSMALGVQEAWLMGFDVPRQKTENAQKAERDFDLIRKFSLLSERDQKIIMNMIESMLN